MGISYKEAVGFVKQAGIYTDMLRSGLGNAGVGAVVQGGAGLASLGGQIHGVATDTPEDAKADSGMNFIPGYGTSQVIQQRRNLSKQLGNEHDKATAASEQFGGMTANLLPAVVLAALGGYAGYKHGDAKAKALAAEQKTPSWVDPEFAQRHADSLAAMGSSVRTGSTAVGAALGGLLGGSAGPVMGSLLALLRRRRTTDEQRAYEQGSKAINWLVPGAAEYNAFKARGYIHGQQVEAERKAKEGGDKGEDKDKKKKPEDKKDGQK